MVGQWGIRGKQTSSEAFPLGALHGRHKAPACQKCSGAESGEAGVVTLTRL